MKRILTIVLLIFAVLRSDAQQMPQYTNYMINYFALNPAAAGTPGCLLARVGYRTQWVGMESAPQTTIFTIQTDLNRKKQTWKSDKHGVGLKFENDVTGYSGPITKINMHAAYAYHKPIGTKKFLSFGIYAGIVQYDFKFDNIKLPETTFLDDPLTSGGARRAILYPDISPGVMYYTENGYIGYTARNVLRNKLRKIYGPGATGRLAIHNYLTMGRRFGRDDGAFSYIPSVNIKMAGHIPPSFDLTFMVDYRNIVDVGIQYRYIDGVNTIINLRFKNFQIGYSYDYNLSPVRYVSGNSHELMFGYRFCAKDSPENVPSEHCPAYR
jgi:type IX secretion system PorP/SprF family membrane protein